MQVEGKDARHRHFTQGWKDDWKDDWKWNWKDGSDSKAAPEVTCQYGKECTRHNCKFPHPDGRDIDKMPVDVTARDMMSVLPRNVNLLNEVREARFAHLRLIREASERRGKNCFRKCQDKYQLTVLQRLRPTIA